MPLSHITRIRIAYFSGTGSTARAAHALEHELAGRGVFVEMYEIRVGSTYPCGGGDLLVLLFPVHAFNAPKIVYQWIDSLPDGGAMQAAVISISGGGEISPNTACRLSSIRGMEKKGYRVVYERMIVMPSNWVLKTDDRLAVRLLELLPQKAKKIADDLLSGVVRRTSPRFADRLFSISGEMEKAGAKYFGMMILASGNCTGCGWCAGSCPANNISMQDSRPVFDGKCLLCLRCIYGCPGRALEPRILGFIVLKEGYDLKALEKRMEGVELPPVEELAKGYLWKGVKEYLLED